MGKRRGLLLLFYMYALVRSKDRLYTAYACPYAQRVWIAQNYKGLQDKIQLIPINLDDKPTWYKDVYLPAKVPALEHNNEVKGDSLNLLHYLDSHFEGPKLFPDKSCWSLLAHLVELYSLISKGVLTVK